MTGIEGWNGFTSNQWAIVGIQPASGEYPSRYAVVDNEKMTLYYDKEKANRQGTIMPHMDDWANYKEQITECVIDPSFAYLRPKNLYNLFYQWERLESINGIENLNTSMTFRMYGMFEGCSSLKELELRLKDLKFIEK